MALRELLERDRNEASAYHNLGTVLRRTKRPETAVDSYEESLRLRPANPATLLELGRALKGAGRHAEAAAIWTELIRLVPNSPSATEAASESHQGPAL